MSFFILKVILKEMRVPSDNIPRYGLAKFHFYDRFCGKISKNHTAFDAVVSCCGFPIAKFTRYIFVKSHLEIGPFAKSGNFVEM